MHDYGVLLVSAGRRVALAKLFRRAMESLGLKGRIITADARPDAPAAQAADAHEVIPKVVSPGYAQAVGELCVRHDVNLVVPLIDTELAILAQAKPELERTGATVLVSSRTCNEICADKRRTWRFFHDSGFQTPALLDIQSVLADPHAAYPLLLKPADGSCSIGVTVIRDRRELEFFSSYTKAPILQPLISGVEYTVDVLVDFQGRARCATPRRRVETRAGEVSKGVVEKRRDVMEASARVAEALPGAVGCQTIQCFLTPEEEIVFIEVNPRFGGGFPLAAEAGADYPRWIIEWTLGRDPAIGFDAWEDGLVMLRWDDAYFLPRERLGW